MANRREFLSTSLRGSSLVALSRTVPGFLARTARGAWPTQDGRVLVVIQLDGGNDGVNTVVPFRDDGYARNRRILRLSTKNLLKLNDDFALNPYMRAGAKLWEAGQLAIVPGVSYPSSSRSHFESMAVWHTGITVAEKSTGTGWLGRGLDDTPDTKAGLPTSVFAGPGAPPVALKGRRAFATCLERLDELALDADGAALRVVAGEPEGEGLQGFLRRATLDAYATADRLARPAQDDRPSAAYPRSHLAERLRLISELLKGGHDARVFYSAQQGYDTHSTQLDTHNLLLRDLSDALKAFLDDLALAKLDERVLVLVFSEFGRRVDENGSAGTDHGASGPVFLAGPGVRPGFLGSYPSLTDLDDGALKQTVDFRQVYATLLDQWLRLPANAILGGEFAPLPVLRA